jgi:serine/threonine protein kinase
MLDIYNELLTEYLSKEEIISILNSYDDNKKHNINDLLAKFHGILWQNILPLLIGEQKIPQVCGSGTTGFVVSLENYNFDFANLEKNVTLYRVRKSNLPIPTKLALKIQIFNEKDKYWETRVLREEFIQNKLSLSNKFTKYIPNFYFGCTVNMPHENDIIKVRLTFMDLIINKNYITLFEYLQNTHGKLSQNIYTKIEVLIKSLWRFGISHNDLSLNNILIHRDYSINADIKLIDFGLSTMIVKLDGEDNNLASAYLKYFEKLDKIEQNGSNVQKLAELLSHV